MKKIFTYILIAILSISFGFSQTVTIGTGTTEDEHIPIAPYWGYSYTQNIYLQSEIATSGDITEIRFQFNGNSSFTDDITVYIGHTTKSSFSSTTDWVPTTSMTQVYSGNYSVSNSAGWYSITLSTPFTYNNSDNLVIAVDENTSGYHSGSDDFYCTSTSNNRSLTYYNDSNNPDPASPPTADANQSYIANVQLVFTSSTPMTYSSCTTTQNNTDNVSANSTNNEVIGIEVVTSGSTSPLDATSFTFNTTGTDDPANDIANATLWYTGTSSTFATTTQVGSVVSNPNGTFTINGTQTLSSGTNYFWLTYDVQSGATLGNVIDAQCTSVTVDGTAHTPSTTNPAGNRLIDYCTFSNSSGGSYYIDNFSTTGGSTNITNNGSGFAPNGYGDYTSMTVTQEQGVSINYSVSFGSSSSYTFGLSIWVDWNQDGDFSDAGENVYLSSSYSSSYSGSFSVPTSATIGDTRMRIVADYTDSSPDDPCSGADEVEDYTFHVNVGTPMTYSSSTVTQNNTSDTYKGLSNVEIIGVEITTTGHLTPIDVSSFTFNTTGSTNPSTDITNAKLWATGTSSTFATTTQIGNVVSGPNGTFTISSGSNLPYTLEHGTNYFWLTYDVPTTATINDYLDAQCTSVTVDGTAHTPSTTAPSGNRKIIAPPTFDGTFESASNFSGNGMTEENDAQNYWIVGTATNNGGSNSAYITNDGSSNNYDNSATSVSHFYFDYLFPAGQSVITLSFDWKCEGEGSSSDYDNLKVFVEPTTETPVAGTENNSSYQVGSTWYNLSSTSWNSESISLPASFAGTIKRIVFQWKNDGSVGTDPPAAVDNIIIDTHVPAAPNCAENLSPADGATDVCNATVNLTWDAPSTGDAPEGYYLYFGTDNPPTNIENGTDLGDVNSYDPGTLTENTTYYWQIIPYNSGGNASGCSVYSFTTGDGQANDLPCNAETIALGSTASGSNECTSDDNEPGAPSCWTSGDINSVWFSFTAPLGGAVDIATTLGTINSTQIAVYSGTCTSLTLVDCNEDAPSCGSSYDNSQLNLTGLTGGQTYYIRVDGENDDVGDFNISVAGGGNLPLTYGQDCGVDNAIPVCDLQYTVGDPGFQAIGNNCDFDGSQDCTGGERGAVWYDIVIDAAGTLTFTLVPNDYDPSGSVGNETDYDFLLYRVASGSTDSSTVSCSCINDNTCGPIRCDFSYLGITGMNGTSDDDAPAPYNPDYNSAFVAALDVLAGDEYYLVIQNYSNSTSGFSIDFNSTPIAGTGAGSTPTSLTWTGGANSTDWYDPLNWGDCAYYPNSTIDAHIIASSTYLPDIDAVDPNNGNNAQAKNLYIESGANLTLDANQTLEIYGDYTNNGVFNADATSITLFTGSANQDLDGSLQNTSAFGNLYVDKSAGYVRTLQDIEIKGDFYTASNSSVFNLLNKTFKLGGDFDNYGGSTTFQNTTSSYFVFNGQNNQAYSPGTGNLYLHDVSIENTGANYINLSADMQINSSGTLTLSTGLINTSSYKVLVENSAASAVNDGNYDSYVYGNLKRKIATNTSTYSFPVGDATGYRLAQLINGNLTGTTYLTAKFLNSFTNTGSLNTSIAQDGGTPYQSISTEGIWQIDPDVQPSGGNYEIRLWFNDGNGGNAFSGLSDNKFGPLKRSSSSTSAADWSGYPTGDLYASGGTGRTVSGGFAARRSISSFSQFAIGKSDVPLPINLLNFSAKCLDDYIDINWATSSEINNDYFTLEKSSDLVNFKTIAKIEGQGNSSEQNDYSFNDFDKLNQQYYKLKQTDFNGKYWYSNIISVNCKNADNNSFIIFNDNHKISLNYFGEESGKYKVSLIDYTGRLISSKFININNQEKKYTLFDINLAAGVYNVVLSNDNNVITKKIVVLK